MAAVSEWLIAQVGGGRYGLPVNSVGEIVEIRPPTRIPLAPDFFRGMVSNKGEILPVVDAGALLADRPLPEAQIAVVVRQRDVAFGLLVQAVAGIRKVAAADVAATPVSGYRERFFQGTVHEAGTLTTLLNLDALVPFLASSLESYVSEGAAR